MNTHTTRECFLRPQPRQAGFTLIEIMVGLVIGMLATLVVMQVFSVFENQKRTTTGAADALTDGNIALFKISRDAQAAGYSLASLGTGLTPFGCALPLTIAESGVSDIFPISVVDSDGGTNSDSLTLRYGTTQMGGIPTSITVASPVTVRSNFGCSRGDITLVMNGTACTVSHVTALPQLSNGSTLGTVTLADNTNVVVPGATLSCLGAWREVTYQVNPATNNLEMRDSLGSNPTAFNPIAAGIVNLQVQYGISATPNSNSVVAWVEPVGAWAIPSVANRNLIKAFRIAIVARDAKLDVNNVTSACNTGANTGLCAWADIPGSPAPVIDLGSADANWQRYRYRVFETVIPFRNVVFAGNFL